MSKLSAIGFVLLLELPACSAESRQDAEDSFQGAADTTREETRDIGQRMEEGYQGAREGYEHGAE